jgi:hypothetical protein
VRQVRVLEPGKWAVWRKIKNDATGKESWQVHEKGEHKVNGKALSCIPFVFFPQSFGLPKPPLLDLAYLNCAHYQSLSDQQTILHTARVPILFVKGMGEGEGMTLGTGTFVTSTSPDADMKYVEHTGAAIEAGRQSLLDLENQMKQIGAELVVQRPNLNTAAQTQSEGEASKSILQRITESFEESLEDALSLMCEWKGIEAAEIEVSMFKDFNAVNLADTSTTVMLTAVDKGIVSKETAFAGLQRRDIIPAEITWEEEAKRIASEPKPEAGKPEAETEDEPEKHDADENAADGKKTDNPDKGQ